MKNPLKKIKRLKSLQKAEVYLEPTRASTMELFVNILNGFIFSQYKLYYRSSTGLYISLWKYWDFQSEAKVEQIIAIVTTHSVSCYINKLENFIDQVLRFHERSFANLLKLTLFLQHFHFEMQVDLLSQGRTVKIQKGGRNLE